jgi:phage terminase large subunit-like protein
LAVATTKQQKPNKERVLILKHHTATDPQRRFWRSSARFRLFVGGIGSGKTRAGCVEVLRQPAGSRGMVLAPTYPMLRDATLHTFLELTQRAGILTQWHKAEMTAELSDGKQVMFRSTDNPDRLRGPNIGWFYLDEAAMMPIEAWNIMIGRLRLGPGKGWATSTPRGMNWLQRTFSMNEDYEIIRSSTRDNPYLPAGFIDSLMQTYSTRLIRQEVEGEFIEDVEGALWTYGTIDSSRVSVAPAELAQVVVAVDPAISQHEESDETGIVVVGKDAAGEGYVLADYSGKYSPDGWARKAVWALAEHKANSIVIEKNQGGDMVKHTIRTVDKAAPVVEVHASRGKYLRAEPVAALYEQGRVHHVGTYPKLEEQMTTYVPGLAISPDRLDAAVHGFTQILLAGRVMTYA